MLNNIFSCPRSYSHHTQLRIYTDCGRKNAGITNKEIFNSMKFTVRIHYRFFFGLLPFYFPPADVQILK